MSSLDNNESVLVTGGAGYIGSHVAAQLRASGRRVVVLDNLSTGFREAVGAHPLEVADVGDRERVRDIIRTHRVRAVMHFAAHLVVPESVADPLEYYRNNTCSTRALLGCCADEGVARFIFSSTAAVYGDVAGGSATEDTPTNPESPYGRSKMMSEMMLRDVCAVSDLGHVILRYFNVAGADPSGDNGQRTAGATHLVKVACEAALGKRAQVEVFGTDYPTRDGTGVRDYIHVSDLAAAHVDALAYLEAGGESVTLNCGYGRGYSVREVLATVERVSGSPFPVVESPRRPGDPASIVASAERIRRVLGWTPRHDDLDVIVGTALGWERRLQ